MDNSSGALMGAGLFGGALGGAGGAAVGKKLFKKHAVPELQQAELDPATKALQDRLVNESKASTDEIYNQVSEGARNAGGQAIEEAPQKMADQAKSLAMDPALGEAINRKAKQSYESGMNDFERTLRNQAPVMRSQRLAQASGNLAKQALMLQQRNELAYQAFSQKMAIRNQMLQNLFGTAGAVGGIAAGGGFSGGQSQPTNSSTNLNYHTSSSDMHRANSIGNDSGDITRSPGVGRDEMYS